MADVFISYASSDRERARLLAERLGERGFEVWWDRTIPPGRVFDEVIQEALESAGSVIVLWSAESVRSNWVKTEASEGLEENKLVPALIEPVEPPMEFKRIQAADLVNWSGDVDHPEFRKLLASVERLARGPRQASRPHQTPGRPAIAAPSASTRRPRWLLLASVLLAGLLVASGLAWLGRRPAPAQATSAESPSAGVVRGGDAVPSGAEQPEAPAPVPADLRSPAEAPAAAIASERVNLLAPANGGELVTAAHERWTALIDGDDKTYAWVDQGEGVFAFKDGRRATFDTFAVLVPDTSDTNLRDFELLVADDLAGPFRSIGTFATQNLRVMKNPFQEFRFPPTTAKYLKLRPLKNHVGSNGAIAAYEFQLHGKLE